MAIRMELKCPHDAEVTIYAKSSGQTFDHGVCKCDSICSWTGHLYSPFIGYQVQLLFNVNGEKVFFGPYPCPGDCNFIFTWLGLGHEGSCTLCR
jgi:hypothetical protein